jgi:carbon-monoxide dehydrogenase medium subunit
VLEGDVVARGPKGQRTIAAADLFQDAMTTALASDEILTEVRLPVMPRGAGYAVEEFARRHGDFAIAAVATMVVRDGGRCTKARIATAGVETHSRRLRAAETILEERGLSEDAISAAAAKAAELVAPMTDHNASVDYRRQLAGVLTERALKRAAAAAR